MLQLAYVSGEIETQNGQCMVENQVVECPREGQSLLNCSFLGTEFQEGSWSPDILPKNLLLDTRNDPLFIGIFLMVVFGLALLWFFKVKLAGKTLAEYLKPIWYFIVGAVAVVFSQYLIFVPYSDVIPWFGNLTQALWALCVALSGWRLIKKHGFNFWQVLTLGILYTFIIHSLKVSIRYFFYGKSLFYCLDRFLYGGLLVMIIVVVTGLAFLLEKKLAEKGIR